MVVNRDRGLLVLFCSMLLGLGVTASAQVNTEAMRRLDLESGWHGNVNLSLGSQSGNTDLLTLRASLRTDYRTKRSHAFLVTNFRLGRKDGESFTNKGFAHLRGIRSLSSRLMIEGFLQKQFNQSILLDDRDLAGGGLRVAIIRYPNSDETSSKFWLFAGIGAMWEREELDVPGEADTNLIRSTNYLTGVWELNERIALSGTGYYQADVERLADFRILFEGGLQVAMTENFAFSTKLNLRYDSEPPADIEASDVEIVHGVSYSF